MLKQNIICTSLILVKINFSDKKVHMISSTYFGCRILLSTQQHNHIHLHNITIYHIQNNEVPSKAVSPTI